MKHLYLSLLCIVFLLSAKTSLAQNAGIKGFLADSATKTPVDYATVAVFNLNDSSIVNFALTDAKGGFELSRLPLKTPLRLFISHVLYGSMRINLKFDSDTVRDLDTLYLVENTAMLGEAVISWEQPPILIRNDTVEFNADAFINRPGSMVEDLLKRIPGMEFSDDGKITVNGKEVSKITLDSKDFFTEDPVILLKNLPAKAIQTVQVSEEKDDRGKPTNSGKVTINLKLKSWAKTGHFGKAYAGYGSDDRYEAGAIWNFFRDTLQVSVLAYGNNLSNAGFSYSDLMQLGGFNRSGSNTTIYYGDGRVEMDGISTGGGSGITESAGAGLNLNYDIPLKLKVSGSYFFGYTNTYNFQQTLTNTNMTDSSLIRQSNLDEISRRYQHSLQAKLSWTPDSIHQFKYTPGFSFQHGNNLSTRIIQSEYSNQSGSNSLNTTLSDSNNSNAFSGGASWSGKWVKWEHSIYQYHSFRKGGLDGNNLIRQFYADTNLINFSSNQVRSNQTDNTNLSQGYTATKFINDSTSLDFGVDVKLEKSVQNTTVHQNDSNGFPQYILLPSLSTQFHSDRREYNSGFFYTRGLKRDWQLNASFELGVLQLQLENKMNAAKTNKSFLLMPAQLSFRKNTPVGVWHLSLDYEPETPYNWDLLDVADNRNPNSVRIGNSNLNVSDNYSVGGRYFGSIGKSGISVWSYASYNVALRQIIYRTKVTESGNTETRPENLASDKVQRSSSGYMSLSKRFNSKSWSHRLGASLNYWASNGYTAFNDDFYTQGNYHISSALSYTLEKKDVLDMTVRYQRGYGVSSVQDLNSSNKQNSDQVRCDVWWAMSKKNWVEMKYTFNVQRVLNSTTIPQQYALLNVSFTRLIFKDNRGQLRLSVFDVLGQNTHVRRWVYLNNSVESQSNVVTRYAMLSFVYNLHQFKTSGRSKRGYEFW
ncbi:MAG: hypothetical protein EP332_03420 [Bacteroidetes bacterium]|nr:MAG: hypothetical protein EP332_03420 [Bacteroidota bacterium]